MKSRYILGFCLVSFVLGTLEEKDIDSEIKEEISEDNKRGSKILPIFQIVRFPVS